MMKQVSLNQVNENILELKKEIEELKECIHEDFELADGVIDDIEESRKRPKKELISHEAMREEFA